jgi:long-subunit acyl-CoA synthetase (AMP-forming)
MLGIYSKNCEPWYISIQASATYGFTIVPLYNSLRKKTLTFILE